jgi:chemotaxis protein CheC
VKDHTSTDPLSLTAVQLDALREVANIGAGHAATALSEMTGARIMISVPRLKVVAAERLTEEIGAPETPVVAVLMAMVGDLTGRTLLLFPEPSARELAAVLTRRPTPEGPLNALAESALKETGNILSGAYLNALSDFLGMVLLNSPPALALDMFGAILTSELAEFGSPDLPAFLAESAFAVDGAGAGTRGFFLLLPDPQSLRAILHAIRLV